MCLAHALLCIDLHSNRVANLSSPKSQTLSQKKSGSSFKAYNTHKTCVNKHKIDIKTRQKD